LIIDLLTQYYTGLLANQGMNEAAELDERQNGQGTGISLPSGVRDSLRMASARSQE
jgi:hypothetical protein